MRCDTCRDTGLARGAAGQPGDFCDCVAGLDLRAQAQARAAREVEMRAQYARDRVAWTLQNMDLPRQVRDWTLENSPVRDDPQGAPAWAHVRGWVDRYTTLDEQPWLVLTGQFGTGKTSLAVGAAKALVERAGGEIENVRFVVASDLFLEIQRGYQEHRHVEVIDRYRFASLLVLDDVGAHYGTEWAQAQFFAILNHRYVEHLPTIITTNLDGAELRDHLTARVMWRVIERAESLLHVKGANRHDPRVRARGSRRHLEAVSE